VLILNKLDTASADGVARVRRNILKVNPGATVIDAAMPVALEQPEAVRGKAVLVVEDGPTLTHGGMGYGAGVIAASRFGARELIDPRPSAVGSIQETFRKNPHIGKLLPAMGYGARQMSELEATINDTACDLVLIATPVDLRRVINIRRPACRVGYELQELGAPTLADVVKGFLDRARPTPRPIDSGGCGRCLC
jgi:predicted GTPase